MKDVSKVFLSLIGFEFGENVTAEVKNLITPKVLQVLFGLSKAHDLVHLVGDALDKNEIFYDCIELKNRFLHERNVAVCRYEQIKYELEQICKTLEGAKIAFVPLKGSVFRAFYPEAWMRTSCDIDVLVEEENLQSAIKVLEGKLLYKSEAVGSSDAHLIAESGVHVELHFKLYDDSSKESVKEVLKDVWRSLLSDEYHGIMKDEFFYCYHISHIAKHLRYGGCGVRSVLDTWILNHKIRFDKSKRDEILQKAGLLTVANAVEKLGEVWFSNEKADSLSEDLAEYIMMGGVFGSFENRVAAQQSRKKNKFTYLLSRLFVPYSILKFKYPRLKKYPFLYPFYLVKRWCLLLKRDTKVRAKKELEQVVNSEDTSKSKVAKLLKELDLQ